MFRLMLALVLVGHAAAEIQIDVDPTGLPAGAIVTDVMANIGIPDSNADYSSVISGPSGFPLMWHAVWQVDDAVPLAQPINSMTLMMDCGGTPLESTLTFPPFTRFYTPGPNNPPDGPTVFEGLDPSDNCVRVVPPSAFPEGFGLVSVSPNPFNPTAIVRFNLPATAELAIQLFDLRGHQVRQLFRGVVQAGEGELQLDGADLASGVYMLALEQGGRRDSTSVTLVK